MNTMIRLLREARDIGYDIEVSLDFRWNMMNKGAKRMPEDDLNMEELDRRSVVVGKAKTDIQKIIDDLLKELSA
jgi:hypothetical protein